MVYLPNGNMAKDSQNSQKKKDLVKIQKKKKKSSSLDIRKMHNLRCYHVIFIRLMTTENYCLIMLSICEDTER